MQSQVVRRAYFTFGDIGDADFILTGTARRTRYYGRLFSYGLSVYGPLLWIVGLPCCTSENLLMIELTLTDPDGEQVWTYSFENSESVTQTISPSPFYLSR